MSSADLALRYLIIVVAWHLACAWAQTFQSPYPIADAFKLAGTAEEQLFKSLGISWRGLGAAASKVTLISILIEGSRRGGTGLPTRTVPALHLQHYFASNPQAYCMPPISSNAALMSSQMLTSALRSASDAPASQRGTLPHDRQIASCFLSNCQLRPTGSI